MTKTSFSMLNLILQADFVVQLVIIILVGASIFSWATVCDKFFKFRLLKKRSDEFEDLFEQHLNIDQIYDFATKNNNHPLARIFLSCLHEWKNNDVHIVVSKGVEKIDSFKTRLNNAMQIACNKSLQKIEHGLNVLAIIGSITPFVGLFGTVWGIMNSFQSIALSKNTSLAVVAPGIAESLLATAIGLFAAIPAVFFYNVFSAKINHFQERANNFCLTLFNLLSQELDK
ncbi:MAG: protein TolQ [Proteobacteria bacterium]|nr:protein TolQ [Pseudomonadota bacterium]